MGFEHVDKQFRKPEPIRLECSDCASTDDTVQARRDVAADQTIVLCTVCAVMRTPFYP